MKFELITKDNIMLATNIQLRIFKDENECAYLHYLNSFICNKDYYIVYKANEPVGITGLYIDEFTQDNPSQMNCQQLFTIGLIISISLYLY